MMLDSEEDGPTWGRGKIHSTIAENPTTALSCDYIVDDLMLIMTV
jgi:hypothetical protein